MSLVLCQNETFTQRHTDPRKGSGWVDSTARAHRVAVKEFIRPLGFGQASQASSFFILSFPEADKLLVFLKVLKEAIVPKHNWVSTRQSHFMFMSPKHFWAVKIKEGENLSISSVHFSISKVFWISLMQWWKRDEC